MAESKTNPAVDAYLGKVGKWRGAFEQLRSIILDCDLSEDLKWGKPCYSLQGKNVVLIHGFKDYCAILFFKGALLTDAGGVLIQQTENVQAARQIRFTDTAEIAQRAALVTAYVREAIELEKSGATVTFKTTQEFEMPDAFRTKLDEMPTLKTAFATLTPGRQRAYLLHFSGAKQSKTREARIEKAMPKILDGQGLDD